VIGTPEQNEWPEDVSITWGSFCHRKPVDLQTLVPDICEQGKDLLQVIFIAVNLKLILCRTFTFDLS
jgi:hypothetical protein